MYDYVRSGEAVADEEEARPPANGIANKTFVVFSGEILQKKRHARECSKRENFMTGNFCRTNREAKYVFLEQCQIREDSSAALNLEINPSSQSFSKHSFIKPSPIEVQWISCERRSCYRKAQYFPSDNPGVVISISPLGYELLEPAAADRSRGEERRPGSNLPTQFYG